MPGIDGLSALEGRPTSVLIADQLRERIVDGSFSPGEQVTEAQLAAKLRVSRGPVREALQRLSQEGLLVSHRNRGVFVLELTPHDVREIYAARQAIELSALDAIRYGGEDQLASTVSKLRAIVAKMPDVVAEGNWRRLAELDLSFHTTFVDGSGNSRLSRIYSTLAAESRICIMSLEVRYPRVHALVEEHEVIVDLLDEHKFDELHGAIVKHMATAIADLTASMNV
ncbi:GntR family transcriptional regulator [Saxibacter everestensis]|uniref:GntR family transcriptional regulator n=1 Tax=Saxibacter everestensis TaxID=2909229 RepID=A0ABY8QQN8_9MICO|nr:GntR family transcriptional regulator [Brevibacteriaceae bacterium ZFBP1038]